MADTVTTRHRISGAVDRNTPLHVAEHPILGKHLDIVPEGTKPFTPELHKAKTEPVDADVKIPEVKADAPKPTNPNKKD